MKEKKKKKCKIFKGTFKMFLKKLKNKKKLKTKMEEKLRKWNFFWKIEEIEEKNIINWKRF